MLLPDPPATPAGADRTSTRRRLCAARDAFLDATPGAHAALAAHLHRVLVQLEPAQLGLYWALRSEFNAAVTCSGDRALDSIVLSLPYARRNPPEMQYRTWDGQTPTLQDECGIPAAEGAVVVPEVILVPCVGYTASGFRLGYGGGYFDRYMAAHPHVTAVGVAWSVTCMSDDEFAAQAHDMALMAIVTEKGVVGD